MNNNDYLAIISCPKCNASYQGCVPTGSWGVDIELEPGSQAPKIQGGSIVVCDKCKQDGFLVEKDKGDFGVFHSLEDAEKFILSLVTRRNR